MLCNRGDRIVMALLKAINTNVAGILFYPSEKCQNGRMGWLDDVEWCKIRLCHISTSIIRKTVTKTKQ